MAVSIPLQFLADFAKSTKEIEKFSKDSAKSIGKIESSLGNVAKGALAAGAAYFSARGLISALKSSVQAASVQESAINSLNTALATAGDFSIEASEDMQRFASELQNASTVGDETTLQMLALAKTFGTTNDQAKDLVTAAVELSAATGLSLESAVTNLGKTLSGLGGELSERLPQLRGLSAESLKAGAAIELALTRFEGSAAAKLQTFEGAVTGLSLAFSDLQEQIGFAITQNPEVVKLLNVLKTTFEELGKILGTERKGLFSGFVSSVAVIIQKTIPALLEAFQGVAQVVGFLQKVFNMAAYGTFVVFNEVVTTYDRLAIAFQDSVRLIVEAAANAARFFGSDESAKNLQAFADSLGTSIQSRLDEIKLRDETVALIGEDLGKSTNEFEENVNRIAQKLGNAKVGVQALIDAETRAVGGTPTNSEGGGGGLPDTPESKIDKKGFFKEVEDNQKRLAEEAAKNSAFIQSSLQNVGGFLQAIERGAEGAQDAVIQASTLIADSLLPGLGSVIGPLLNFAKDPEAFKGFLTAFIDALPEVIKTLGQGLGEVLIILAENTDEIFLAIVENIPEVVESLIRAAPKIVLAAVKAVPAILKGIGGLVAELFKVIVKLFEEGGGELAAAFEASFTAAFARLGASLSSILINFTTVFKRALDTAFSAIAGFVTTIGETILQIPTELLSALETLYIDIPTKLGDAFVNAADGLFDGVADIGQQIVDGIKEPFTNLIDSLNPGKAAKRAGNAIKQGVEDVTGISFGLTSPSQGGDIINGTSQAEVYLAAILRELKLIRESGGKVVFGEQRKADQILSLNRQNQRTA